MIRTRLLWFTSGFLTTATSISYFLHRDLNSQRYLLFSQFENNFGALETRISNLESPPQISIPQQSTGQSVSQDGGSSS